MNHELWKMQKSKSKTRDMKIEINNQANCKIDLNLVKQVAAEFARVYKIKDQEISIAFVRDAEMKKINQAYRGLNQPTDVLAFPPSNNAEGNLTGQAGDGEFLGEIIIDYSQIRRQAGRFNNSAKQEMVFILVHGLLHLLGYDDETEKGRLKMVKMGEEFIKKYPPS